MYGDETWDEAICVPCSVADIAKKYSVCVEQALTYLASHIIGGDCGWALGATLHLVRKRHKGGWELGPQVLYQENKQVGSIFS